MQIVVLDGYTTNPGDLDWNFLSSFGEYRVYDRTKSTDIFARCRDAEIILTNKTILSKETINQLENIKYIGLLSTGFNVVDIDAAKARGVPVTNIPTYSTQAVTQLTFALLLEMTNQVALHASAVHRGEWSACMDFCFWKSPLTELASKHFGIIGYGKIGKSVARVASAFGMQVLAHDNYAEKDTGDEVAFVSLDELLQRADVVSIHAPLTNETQGLVNADFLSKMKPSAFLINTARGPIVDEAALANALTQGTIAGAGIDVLSVEPPQKENPLFGCRNCFITPHIAWAAPETRNRLLAICEENIRAFLGGNPIHVVNP